MYFDKRYYRHKAGKLVGIGVLATMAAVIVHILLQLKSPYFGQTVYYEFYDMFLRLTTDSDSLVDRLSAIFTNLRLFLQNPLFGDTIANVLHGTNHNTSSTLILYAVLGILGGTLNVAGNCKHAIVSKDDLVLAGVTMTVNAASTGLDGKDCVMLHSVSAEITAGSNGIRSDNAEDAGRGFVYILDSTLTINAGSDGVQAETLLRADNAVMTITTGEGSGTSSQSNGSEWDSFGGSSGSRGSSGGATSTGSWKGLKSAASMEINGGAYVIDAQDDCIHTNGNLTITDGLFTLASADDGIHADNELLISGGEFDISKSYEGIEASKLTIAGGKIDITASDDGLNAAGGADGSATADRWGRGAFSNMVGEIVISGGYIHINASGDGIDSNNNILVSGGVTLVSGSSNSANAAFDYDGQATVTGGILIAAGGSGMAQSFTAAENQGCMLFGINGASGGVNLAIVDAADKVVAAFTPENSYSAVVVTAPGLQVGSTYNVVMGAEIDGMDSYGFATDAVYTGGTNIGAIEMTTLLQGGSGHGMGGGFGGGGGGRRGW